MTHTSWAEVRKRMGVTPEMAEEARRELDEALASLVRPPSASELDDLRDLAEALWHKAYPEPAVVTAPADLILRLLNAFVDGRDADGIVDPDW